MSDVRVRPARDDDRELLLAVYRSTREAELDTTDWDGTQRDVFVRQQFEAQDRFYREQYPDASFVRNDRVMFPNTRWPGIP